MASVSFALGIAWAPVVVLVSAVPGVPAAAVDLTAVDVPGVPSVARVCSAVLTNVDFTATAVSRFLCPGCCWGLSCSGHP